MPDLKNTLFQTLKNKSKTILDFYYQEMSYMP